MKKYGILLFGLAESAIGTATLAAIIAEILSRGVSSKPANVLVFVVISSCISLSLGIGILLRRRYARKFLIFFAGWVILSKILITMEIMTLCCALETQVPPNLKNAVSAVYHGLVMFFFHHPAVKKEFER